MRAALGPVARVLLVALVLAAAGLIAHLALEGMLSAARLERAMATGARESRRALAPALASRHVLAALAFALGAAAGWLAAFRWIGRRMRRRPLIIADLRHADMSFADGIRHIRAAAPPADDAAAIGLILREASDGRLTLWRRASADTLWRVPARQVRAVAARLADTAATSWSLAPWQNFMLLAAEMERLWPSRAVAPARATALSRAVPEPGGITVEGGTAVAAERRRG